MTAQRTAELGGGPGFRLARLLDPASVWRTSVKLNLQGGTGALETFESQS